MKTMKYGLNALLLTLMLVISSVTMAGEVNVNTADAQTIADALKGIGLKKAEAIVSWRTANGNFKTISELENVKGIGAKILASNKDDIQL
jgi:competence protein ComEA